MDRVTDLTFLKDFSKGDPERMKKYMQMFINLAPASIEKIKTNHQAGDWPALRTTAHSLKPQIGYMGMNDYKDVILSIEHNAGEEKNLEDLPGLIETLESGCKAAIEELNAEIEALG